MTGSVNGERVNPGVNGSLEITSLSSTETGLSNGNGFAVDFTVRNGPMTSGVPINYVLGAIRSPKGLAA